MYKEWKYYWLTKCINKNHNVNGHVSHNHLYIHVSRSKITWLQPCCCYLHVSRDGCVKHMAINTVVLVYALCRPVTLPFLVCELFLASSFIPPSLHLFDFCKKSFQNFLLMLFFNNNCYVVLPMHLWLMRHPIARAPTNGFQQLVHCAPLVFPAKKHTK